MGKTYKLTAPVMWGDKEVTEVIVRSPTGKEIREVGQFPFSYDETGRILILTDVACKYISKCSGLPPSVVDQLGPYDLSVLSQAYFAFFLTPGQK